MKKKILLVMSTVAALSLAACSNYNKPRYNSKTGTLCLSIIILEVRPHH